MSINRMVELLEIEHTCMLRGAHDDCDRNCADCELVQDDNELHEMYTNVISMLKEREAKNVVNMTLSKNYSLIASCPKCNALLTRVEHKNYCGICGQAVKWE